MTEKLFEQDSYLSTFTARVVACEKTKKGYEVVLDRTAFFPEGGGQPFDQGWLGSSQVKEVFIKEGIIYHVTDSLLEKDSQVEGEIDFARRFDFMQQHSGEHIVSGIINKLYGFNNVGFHLSESNMTADLDGELTEEEIRHVEYLANEAIYKNVPFTVTLHSNNEAKAMVYRSKIDIAGDIRIVEAKGYDTCACCGTHVRSAGEIGMIKCIGQERHRGGTRLSLVCGKRALLDYQLRQEIVAKSMALLSAQPEKVVDKIGLIQAEQNEAKLKLGQLSNELYDRKAKEIVETTEPAIIVEEEGLLPEELRRFCLALIQKTNKICLVLNKEIEGYKYAIGHQSEDIRPLCKQLNQTFNGKGGGNKELCQGSLVGEVSEIKLFLQ